MPELTKSAALTTRVSPELNLPVRFPKLPESILNRFGDEAKEFDQELERFWRKAQLTLTQAFEEQVAAPQNRTAENLNNLTALYQQGDATLLAMITTEQGVRAAADSALASRASALEASVDTPVTGLLARVTTIESAYVDAGEAYAEAINAITAELAGPAGSIYASVQAEATARATADGNLEGKYTLTVAAGDVVTGMNITSASGPGTPVSEVKFQANKFQIWNGSAGIPVFDLSGSNIRLAANVAILGNLDVGAGINRAFIGETSPGDYTIRRGVFGGNRLEMFSNAGGGSNDYSQFRAFNSGGNTVAILGTEQANSYGLLQLNNAAGSLTLAMNGDNGRITFSETIQAPFGSATQPPYTFATRTGDGLYSAASQDLGVALGGVTSFNLRRSGNVFSVEMGAGRTGDGDAFIDLIGDGTYSDYGLRVVRGGGAGGDSGLFHRGGGNLLLNAQDSGAVLLSAGGATRLTANSSGVSIGTLSVTNVASNINLNSGQVFQINGTQVVGPRGAAISDVSSMGFLFGSDTTDNNAIQSAINSLVTAFNDLLARVRAHGLIGT
ncbi:MAG: DUF1983 domain-containing protein [Opitutaceae bacterium]|nr:DUF1983 domain-containing protein [Opitutaceae bacterium]